MENPMEMQKSIYGLGKGPPMLYEELDDKYRQKCKKRRKLSDKSDVNKSRKLSTEDMMKEMRQRRNMINEEELSTCTLPGDFPPELGYRALAAYALLRTLSRELRLSPFTPTVFLRALYLPFPNKLMGQVHVSLLRVLLPNLKMGFTYKPRGGGSGVYKRRHVDNIRWPLRAGDNLTYLDGLSWPVFYDDYCHLTADRLWSSIHDEVLQLDFRNMGIQFTGVKDFEANMYDDESDDEEVMQQNLLSRPMGTVPLTASMSREPVTPISMMSAVQKSSTKEVHEKKHTRDRKHLRSPTYADSDDGDADNVCDYDSDANDEDEMIWQGRKGKALTPSKGATPSALPVTQNTASARKATSPTSSVLQATRKKKPIYSAPSKPNNPLSAGPDSLSKIPLNGKATSPTSSHLQATRKKRPMYLLPLTEVSSGSSVSAIPSSSPKSERQHSLVHPQSGDKSLNNQASLNYVTSRPFFGRQDIGGDGSLKPRKKKCLEVANETATALRNFICGVESPPKLVDGDNEGVTNQNDILDFDAGRWSHFEPLKAMRSGIPYHHLSLSQKLDMLEFLIDELLSVDAIAAEFSKRRTISDCYSLPYGILPKASELENLENDDECGVCQGEGELLCCDGCVSSYHRGCLGMSQGQVLPDGKWLCPECKVVDPANYGPLRGGKKAWLEWFSVEDVLDSIKNDDSRSSLGQQVGGILPANTEKMSSLAVQGTEIVTSNLHRQQKAGIAPGNSLSLVSHTEKAENLIPVEEKSSKPGPNLNTTNSVNMTIDETKGTPSLEQNQSNPQPQLAAQQAISTTNTENTVDVCSGGGKSSSSEATNTHVVRTIDSHEAVKAPTVEGASLNLEAKMTQTLGSTSTQETETESTTEDALSKLESARTTSQAVEPSNTLGVGKALITECMSLDSEKKLVSTQAVDVFSPPKVEEAPSTEHTSRRAEKVPEEVGKPSNSDRRLTAAQGATKVPCLWKGYEFLVIHGFVFSRRRDKSSSNAGNEQKHQKAYLVLSKNDVDKYLTAMGNEVSNAWPFVQIPSLETSASGHFPSSRLYLSSLDSFDPSFYSSTYRKAPVSFLMKAGGGSQITKLMLSDYESVCSQSSTFRITETLMRDFSFDNQVADYLRSQLSLFDPYQMIKGYLVRLDTALKKACLLNEFWESGGDRTRNDIWLCNVRKCKSLPRLARLFLRLVDQIHPRAFEEGWFHNQLAKGSELVEVGHDRHYHDLSPSWNEKTEMRKRLWQRTPPHMMLSLFTKEDCLEEFALEIRSEVGKPVTMIRSKKRKQPKSNERGVTDRSTEARKNENGSALASSGKCNPSSESTARESTSEPSPKATRAESQSSFVKQDFLLKGNPSNQSKNTLSSKQEDGSGEQDTLGAKKLVSSASMDKNVEDEFKNKRRTRRSGRFGMQATEAPASGTMGLTASESKRTHLSAQDTTFQIEKFKRVSEVEKFVKRPFQRDQLWPVAGRKPFATLGNLPPKEMKRLARNAGCVKAPHVAYQTSHEVGQVCMAHTWRKRTQSCRGLEELILQIRVFESFLDRSVIHSCENLVRRRSSIQKVVRCSQRDPRSGVVDHFVVNASKGRMRGCWISSEHMELSSLVLNLFIRRQRQRNKRLEYIRQKEKVEKEKLERERVKRAIEAQRLMKERTRVKLIAERQAIEKARRAARVSFANKNNITGASSTNHFMPGTSSNSIQVQISHWNQEIQRRLMQHEASMRQLMQGCILSGIFPVPEVQMNAIRNTTIDCVKVATEGLKRCNASTIKDAQIMSLLVACEKRALESVIKSGAVNPRSNQAQTVNDKSAGTITIPNRMPNQGQTTHGKTEPGISGIPHVHQSPAVDLNASATPKKDLQLGEDEFPSDLGDAFGGNINSLSQSHIQPGIQPDRFDGQGSPTTDKLEPQPISMSQPISKGVPGSGGLQYPTQQNTMFEQHHQQQQYHQHYHHHQRQQQQQQQPQQRQPQSSMMTQQLYKQQGFSHPYMAPQHQQPGGFSQQFMMQSEVQQPPSQYVAQENQQSPPQFTMPMQQSQQFLMQQQQSFFQPQRMPQAQLYQPQQGQSQHYQLQEREMLQQQQLQQYGKTNENFY